MTVLLVLFTLIILLIADHFVQKKRKERTVVPEQKAVPAVPSLEMPVRLPDGVALATNHVWSKANADGTITIGLDEFLGRMLGTVERVTMPRAETLTEPSFADVGVEVQGRVLRLASPVAGRVVETNDEVLRNPSLIATDPYGDGWLVRLQSAREDIAASGHFRVANPVTWLKEQMMYVRDFIAMNAGQVQPVMLQEGGLPVDGVLQQFDAGVWKDFNRSFAMLRRTRGIEEDAQ